MAGKKRPAPKRISEPRPTTVRARPDGNGSAPPPPDGATPPARRTDTSRRAVTQVSGPDRNARGGSAGRGGSGSRPGAPARGTPPTGKARARQSGRTIEVSQRRISPALLGWSGGGLVIVVVVVIVVVALLSSSKNTSSGHVTVPASIVQTTTNVPSGVLDSVGTGGNPVNTKSAGGNPLGLIKGAYKAGDGLPAVNGKPVLFYFGALYCPYCATERWPLIVALSRFGTFKNLAGAVSSSTDVYPSTQTWSFVGSTYTSPYLVFTPVEAEDESQAPLELPNAAETKVLKTWDPIESFPFMTVGNTYTAYLPSWLQPQWLQTLTRQQISQTLALGSQGNLAGQGIDADANYLSAAICAVDGQQPAAVCTSTGVTAAAAQLKHLPAAVPITQ